MKLLKHLKNERKKEINEIVKIKQQQTKIKFLIE